MKRCFDPGITTGDLWEYEPETRHSRWVSADTGELHGISGLRLVNMRHHPEVTPRWLDPALMLPEGM